MKDATPKIIIAGITQRAVNYIDVFMKSLENAGFPVQKMIPLIGMPVATARYDDKGNLIEQTGPRLVLGALEKSQLTDETLLKTDRYAVAIRIPNIDEFAGVYYFDIEDRRFVNIYNDRTNPP